MIKLTVYENGTSSEILLGSTHAQALRAAGFTLDASPIEIGLSIHGESINFWDSKGHVITIRDKLLVETMQDHGFDFHATLEEEL